MIGAWSARATAGMKSERTKAAMQRRFKFGLQRGAAAIIGKSAMARRIGAAKAGAKPPLVDKSDKGRPARYVGFGRG
jgi:hypothetical protein